MDRLPLYFYFDYIHYYYYYLHLSLLYLILTLMFYAYFVELLRNFNYGCLSSMSLYYCYYCLYSHYLYLCYSYLVFCITIVDFSIARLIAFIFIYQFVCSCLLSL